MAEISLTETEIEAAVGVLRSGALRQGKQCQAFEEEFANKVGARYAVSNANGTAALHLAYMAFLKPGDEVLVPSFTFMASASMVSMVGASPVLCDIDPDTFLVDLEDAERKISPRTRAICPVHLFGNPCYITEVQAFADRHDLTVVWDAAQAHGACHEGRDIGSLDDFVCYSFYPSKNMFVGEGGMTCTNSGAYAEQMRHLRTHGQTGKYLHTMLGLNYRMTDVEAAIGRKQLKRLDDMLAVRRRNAELLRSELSNVPGIRVQRLTPDAQHAWHQFCVCVEPDEFGCGRDEVARKLADSGIASGVHYPRGLHQQPIFIEMYGEQSLPVTEQLAERILALPVHHGLAEEEALPRGEGGAGVPSRLTTCFAMPKVAWILNHYALEPGSTGPTRHHCLAKFLPSFGWEMHIIAASVEHTTGRQRVPPTELASKEVIEGVPFLWVRTPDYRGNGWDRFLNMFTYTYRVLTRRCTAVLPRPDVVIGSSLHPFGAWSGAMLAARNRVPFVFEFRDLWPETLVAMGRISANGPTARVVRMLDGWLCRRAVKMFTPIPQCRERVAKYGADPDNLHWIANGVDLTRFSEQIEEQSNSDEFTLMYLGAHGLANDLGTLLDAMTILKRRMGSPLIRCRLIGDGPEKSSLMACAASRELDNVSFEAPVAKEGVPALAAQADAFVICVRDLPELYRYGISMNKLCDYMVMGRPTVAAVNAVNNPISESDSGITVPPEGCR